ADASGAFTAAAGKLLPTFGIGNLGNTCYASSVLWSIAHAAPYLFRLLETTSFNESLCPLASELRRIWRALQLGNGPVLPAESLVRFGAYAGLGQHDAAAYL